MTQSAEEARFKELKDMIAQQNNTIYSLNKTIETMSNMLAEKDQRLAELTEELGGSINRTTMANWAIDCNNLYFKPMTDYFLREAVKRKFLMMDETPIQGYRC